MSKELSVADWAAELQRLNSSIDQERGATIRELATNTGKGIASAREMVRRALASGDWETCRIQVKNMAGVLQPVVGYRPKSKRGR